MSGHSHTRKVSVRSLKKGEELPSDGRVYRDTAGALVLGLRYPRFLKQRHDIRLERIAAFAKRNPK